MASRLLTFVAQCLLGLTLPIAASGNTGMGLERFSLHPAPRDAETRLAAPVHVPEILNTLRRLPTPATGRFSASVTYGIPKKSEVHRFLKDAAKLPRYGGNLKAVPAIYVTSGSVDLLRLSRQPGIAKHLSCDGSRCTLRAPLLVGRGATLVIDGVDLIMSQAHGAHISSVGSLFMARSDVTSLLPEDFVFKKPYTMFRPFVTGLRGSHMDLIANRFDGIGYHGVKSYGISISADKGETPPSARLISNTFIDHYYGFYSHHAKQVEIVGNIYRDNIIYGIDPHDYSEDLYILGNRAYGTKKKHGIVISRGVTRTVISGNVSYANAGSGIMLDRHCGGNLISYNLLYENEGDGIAILESSDNWLVGNIAERNKKAGIRVRNAQNVAMSENQITRNGRSGILLYSAVPNGVKRKAEDVYTEEVTAALYHNTTKANRGPDLQMKGCVSTIRFGLKTGAQPGFTTPRIRLPKERGWRDILIAMRGLPGRTVDLRFQCEAPSLYSRTAPN